MSGPDEFGLEHAPLCRWGPLLGPTSRAVRVFRPERRVAPDGTVTFACPACDGIAVRPPETRDEPEAPLTAIESVAARPIREAIEACFAETGIRPSQGDVARHLGWPEYTLQREMRRRNLGRWHLFVKEALAARPPDRR